MRPSRFYEDVTIQSIDNFSSLHVQLRFSLYVIWHVAVTKSHFFEKSRLNYFIVRQFQQKECKLFNYSTGL